MALLWQTADMTGSGSDLVKGRLTVSASWHRLHPAMCLQTKRRNWNSCQTSSHYSRNISLSFLVKVWSVLFQDFNGLIFVCSMKRNSNWKCISQNKSHWGSSRRIVPSKAMKWIYWELFMHFDSSIVTPKMTYALVTCICKGGLTCFWGYQGSWREQHLKVMVGVF